MAAGGHLEFWWFDWSKYKNDARNGFSVQNLVGKVVLHSFRYQIFRNTSKSSNQVSNLTMLSVVTGPPDCTQLDMLRINGTEIG